MTNEELRAVAHAEGRLSMRRDVQPELTRLEARAHEVEAQLATLCEAAECAASLVEDGCPQEAVLVLRAALDNLDPKC